MILLNLLQWFRRMLFRRRRAVRLIIAFGKPSIIGQPIPKGVLSPMPVTMSVIQDVDSAISGALDAKGNKVPVPTFSTPPVWTSSDTTELTVVAAADGLSAVCTAVGKVGSAVVTATGTPTGASAPISGSDTVTITAAAPASLVLSFGAPAIQQPGVPPPPPPPPV